MTEEKIKELYERYGRSILQMAARYQLQAEQRDEVCQQAFVKLYSCGCADWSEEQIKAWLLVSADILARNAAGRLITNVPAAVAGLLLEQMHRFI